MPRQLVAVAMSGGVDSSVAAAILKQAGYEVSGFHMRLLGGGETPAALEHTCRILSIPLHTIDLEAEFKALVIDYFCREHRRGRTPNPCLACNRHIKFGLLLNKVKEMGADYLATGHYARIEGSSGGYRLLKAADTAKDQSYFLYALGQRELPHLLMPLGGLRKTEVRKLAAELGLPAGSRPDSQDACFIPAGDRRSFIARHIPLPPGDIVDTWGRVLGRHQGLARYTVGQHQGLGLAAEGRMYVLRLDSPNNRLVVGSEEELFRHDLRAGALSWVAGQPPATPGGLTAKVRYRSAEATAEISLNHEQATVRFRQPQRAIAPGQAVVFYQGEAVLGGGIIEGSENAA